MDIYNHFSCYTKLPVLLEDVIAHITEARVVDEIKVYPLELNPTVLRGFCWVFVDKPHNSINHRKIAWIGYSNKLTREMARLTICKELLHLLDGKNEAAQTQDKVSQLIDEIVLPVAAHIALPALSDHYGELRALTVLMPACAIDELAPRLEANTISHETISKHARLPEEYVRLAFTPTWQHILKHFGIEQPVTAAKQEPELGLQAKPKAQEEPGANG